MKKFYSIIISLIAFCNLLFSQIPMVVNRDWVRNFSEKDQITNIPSAIDADGNIYVTGYSFSGGSYNYTTIKYNQQGDTLWIRHYNGTGNSADMATAIALDNSGNVYITGKSIGTGTNFDYATIKYNSAGVQLWASRYNGTGNGYDEATAIVVDNVGNVFVTGYSTGTGTLEDYATVKYNSSGIQQWVKTYNGTGNGFDKATAITINTNNRIIVTGFSKNTTGKYDVVTLRYNSGNGLIQWTKTYTGSFNGDDIANSIINDGTNVIICGSTQITATNSDYLILKYNTSNANQIFSLTYDGYGANDVANSLIIDNTGKFYVTGVCKNNTLVEYHTLEYNNSGVQQWVHKYPLNLPNTNIINKVAIDSWDMIYVCGETRGTNSRDFVLYQLNGNGGQQWVETYNGTANGQDAVNDMVVDNFGHIFVTGQTYNGNAKYDFTTIKYSQTPVFFPPDYNNEKASNNFLFYENKGQLRNTQGSVIPEQRFYTITSDPELFVSDGALSYVFSKIDTSSSTMDTLHRIDMKLVKSNLQTKSYPFERVDGIVNYYVGSGSGITNVNGYSRLLIPNVYPNIDLHYYSNSKGLKYYFVVKPGGNPKDIYIQFDGSTSLEITQAGHLKINSSIGFIEQDKTQAFQVNYSQNIIPVNWNADWIMENSNTVHFNIGNYNTMFPLVLQVDLGHSSSLLTTAPAQWSTYFGGTNDDAGTKLTTDSVGNLYIVGKTASTNFPVYNGVFMGFQGFQDGFIGRFDKFYERIWVTYYGALDGFTSCNGIAWSKVDGKLYITGATDGISSGFPLISNGSYYYDTHGGTTSFFARLDTSLGTVDWSTFFGGFSTVCKSIAIDNSGNFYIVGNTENWHGSAQTCSVPTDGGFPLCNPGGGAYYQSFNSNYVNGTPSELNEGFITKFSNTGSLLWSTFFGGKNWEWINDIAIDPNNRICIVGNTNSYVASNTYCTVPWNGAFPLCNLSGEGHFQSRLSKGCSTNSDAFIARFRANGILEWSTYFGGYGEESGTGIAINNNHEPYMVGYTKTSISTLQDSCGFTVLTPGSSYTQSFGGGFTDNFIAKFNDKTLLLWSSYVGGQGDEGMSDVYSGNPSIAINSNKDVFVLGSTKSPSSSGAANFPLLQLQNSYFQDYNADASHSLYGRSDAYMIAFGHNNQNFWSTYFGGVGKNTSDNLNTSDVGNSVAVFGNDKVFITGYTYSKTEFPVDSPAFPNPYYRPTPVSTSTAKCDAFISQLCVSYFPHSVSENKLQELAVTVYPNPAADIINISFNAEHSENVKVTIYNITGAIEQTETYKQLYGNTKKQINISKLTNGIYFLKIECGNAVHFGKIIKQK